MISHLHQSDAGEPMSLPISEEPDISYPDSQQLHKASPKNIPAFAINQRNVKSIQSLLSFLVPGNSLSLQKDVDGSISLRTYSNIP